VRSLYEVQCTVDLRGSCALGLELSAGSCAWDLYGYVGEQGISVDL
jgi:hypothetical protein